MWNYSSSKPWRGTLKNWCLHDSSASLNVEQWEAFKTIKPGCQVAIITGEVVEDDLKRWQPGEAMHTSMVVYLNLCEMIVETENSVYRLQGAGRFSSSSPRNYEKEVGLTKILLGDIGDSVDDHGSTKGYFHPMTSAPATQ